jgi:hypothetical protein
LAAAELKVQFGVAGVNVPPADVEGTMILVQVAVRPAGETKVVKVMVPSEPVAPKPSVVLAAGKLVAAIVSVPLVVVVMLTVATVGEIANPLTKTGSLMNFLIILASGQPALVQAANVTVNLAWTVAFCEMVIGTLAPAAKVTLVWPRKVLRPTVGEAADAIRTVPVKPLILVKVAVVVTGAVVPVVFVTGISTAVGLIVQETSVACTITVIGAERVMFWPVVKLFAT